MSTKSQAMGWFLTFPQCDMSVDDFLPSLLVALPPVKWAVVCQERHEDNNLHLHAAVMLEKRRQRRNWDDFDAICGKHGDYKKMTSVKGLLEYLQKDPVDICFYGPVPQFGAPTKGINNEIATLLRQGTTLLQVDELHPGYVLHHKRKMEEYQAWHATMELNEDKEKWPESVIYTGVHQATQEVCDWLNANLGKDRTFKQLQLWLYGPPHTHKSSLLRLIEKYFSCYWTPNSELFYDGFKDSECDVIFMDEFREGKPSEWLNSWLEGAPMMVRRKGLPATPKRRIQPVIICSNYLPQQIYGEPIALQCLDVRVKVIKLDNGPLDIGNINL